VAAVVARKSDDEEGERGVMTDGKAGRGNWRGVRGHKKRWSCDEGWEEGEEWREKRWWVRWHKKWNGGSGEKK